MKLLIVNPNTSAGMTAPIAAGVAEQLRHAHGYGAVVIACFGDPGLDAAREAVRAPGLGIAEAAFHAATFLATSLSVVTMMTRTCVIAERRLLRYGFERHCRGVHGTDIRCGRWNPAAKPRWCASRPRRARRWRATRSGAIVLGCAGMASLCRELTGRLGVPVIDGVAAAVKFAEALAALGWTTSKAGDYAVPLPKAYAGWAQGLSW